MAEGGAFAYLETGRIPQTIELLILVEKTARDAGYESIAGSAHGITIEMLRDVNAVAVEMTGLADGLIVRKILETHNAVSRPATGAMESHIVSEAGPLGLVRVALLDELDKIVNERGNYGPFWRAQEYGTGTDEVPSQEGRVLFGTFEDSHTRPDAGQRGLGKGTDLAFVPGGADPGFGTINEELPGRHFLRDGTAEAASRYTERMRAIEAHYSSVIEGMIAELTLLQAERRRAFIGIIEA